MKMFLTRMGQGSRMVVTGDVTQIDLPPGRTSGLVDATSVLAHVPGIEICQLTAKDVVRHELVQAIILAFEKREKRWRGRDADEKQGRG
jgi:phosphate starvation-inducible PhoH-like protein